jgi:hypothetical protein
VYTALTTIANGLVGGVGEVYDDVTDAVNELTDKLGDALDTTTIASLAAAAVKYSIPIGIVLAMLYGGKKVIDKMISEQGVAEHQGVKHRYQMTHPDGSKMKFTANDDADAKRQAKEHGAKSLSKFKGGAYTDKVAEGEQRMSRAAKGNEKYGKDGMKALAKAGREGKDLDKIRDKYNKYDEGYQQGVDEATGDKPFDSMMKKISTGTAKQKTADRKEQRTQTQQQARDAFGNMFGGGNPTDKLKIKEQGRFAGDTPVNLGDVTMKSMQVGDMVMYIGQKAEVVAMSKDRKRARITIEKGMGGVTQDVNTSDLKQLGKGMAEATGDSKFDSMLGNIVKDTPLDFVLSHPVSGILFKRGFESRQEATAYNQKEERGYYSVNSYQWWRDTIEPAIPDFYRKKGMAEAEKKGLYYNVNKRKAAGTSRDANSPKAPTAQAWKDAAKTAKKDS